VCAPIEKDYYCSLLLGDLSVLFGQGLVFKGGTCLSKVYADFFRLSEDLDFGMSVRPEASRSDRRRVAAPIAAHISGVVARLPCFSEVKVFSGENNNKHFSGKLAYRSLVTGEGEPIKIEVSLREEVLLPSAQLAAKTMLIDPFTDAYTHGPVVVCAQSLLEVYAEKARAALTRRELAIRDFFDIDKATRLGLLDHVAPAFLGLVYRKLALTSDAVDLSDARITLLAGQVETQLKPVLRWADYEAFALERVVARLRDVLAKAGRT
jgi:predicted nucleotidyltransferase component of viral defense system